MSHHFIAPVPFVGTRNAALRKGYFAHEVGEQVTVLRYLGSGMYRVRFANDETDVVGRSSLLFI